MTGNSGGPMTVARTGSTWSHDRGERHPDTTNAESDVAAIAGATKMDEAIRIAPREASRNTRASNEVSSPNHLITPLWAIPTFPRGAIRYSATVALMDGGCVAALGRSWSRSEAVRQGG